jgi:hypothetical protein
MENDLIIDEKYNDEVIYLYSPKLKFYLEFFNISVRRFLDQFKEE